MDLDTNISVRGVNSAGNGAWSDAFPSDGAVPVWRQ